MLLYGGISAEREISIITSKEISKSLKSMGYNLVEIDANEKLLADLELHKPDIVFNGLHGTWGEDGCVQEILEKYGVPYTCLLYTSPSPRDRQKSRMPSSA